MNSAPDEGAGDGDALLLPAGQLRSPLAHHRIKLLGELLDEVEGVGLPAMQLNHKVIPGSPILDSKSQLEAEIK